MSVELRERPAPSAVRRVGVGLLRALRVELRIYANIGRFLTRRPAIAPGAVGFGYHRPVLTILWIFIVLSAIEIPILDLIVHRWPAVRIAVLALGIWGLTWMLGLLFGYLGGTFASIQYSILPLLWVLLGGAATTLGPLLGTIFMFYVVDVTSSYTSAYLLIVGVALIVLVLFFPKGVLGTIRERWLPWLP